MDHLPQIGMNIKNVWNHQVDQANKKILLETTQDWPLPAINAVLTPVTHLVSAIYTGYNPSYNW